MTHPDIDRLADVSAVLGTEWAAELRHLAECSECRSALHDLCEMRGALGGEAPPRAGFVDEVVRALATPPARPRLPARAGRRLALASSLAGITFGATLVAAAAASAGIPPTPGLVALSLAAGALVRWRLGPAGLLGPASDEGRSHPPHSTAIPR